MSRDRDDARAARKGGASVTSGSVLREASGNVPPVSETCVAGLANGILITSPPDGCGPFGPKLTPVNSSEAYSAPFGPKAQPLIGSSPVAHSADGPTIVTLPDERVAGSIR